MTGTHWMSLMSNPSFEKKYILYDVIYFPLLTIRFKNTFYLEFLIQTEAKYVLAFMSCVFLL